MFNQISVNLNSVEFEYIEGGRLYCVNVGKPDGVSYSQWSGAWAAFKEFLDSRQPTLSDYVERTIDVSELEALEEEIDDLRRQIDDKNSQIASLEEEIDDMHRQQAYGE